MFVRVIEGLVRFVIVNRAVVLMMVVMDALIVLQLVDERDRVRDRRQAALHGETIHGQAQQQEDVDNPTQGNHRENFANYSSCLCCYGEGYVALRRNRAQKQTLEPCSRAPSVAGLPERF
jgi:hypothetical protein